MWKSIALLMLYAFLTLFPTQAQTAIPISYGEYIEGTFSAIQTTQLYSFEGTAGDVIYITINSFDPSMVTYARLFDANQEMLSESDNIEPLAFISPFELPADGTYFIQAGAEDWATTQGDFTLSVDLANYVALEETLSGSLENVNQLQFITYEATAGELLQVSLRGTDIGITLFDPTGEDFIDLGVYDDPFLPIVEVPMDGMYEGFVWVFSETDYTLTIQPIEPALLTPGEAVTGTISDAEMAVYAFDSSAGKTWSINASSNITFGNNLVIHQIENREWWDTDLAYDGGSGVDGAARIDPFIVPENTRYYVMYYNLEQPETTYEIMLQPSSLLSIVAGLPTEGIVTPQTGDVTYLYEGKASEQITVSILQTSDTGSIGLNIYSTDDELLNFYGEGVSSGTFNITLPLDGMYRFVIHNAAYDGNNLTFTLTVE